MVQYLNTKPEMYYIQGCW